MCAIALALALLLPKPTPPVEGPLPEAPGRASRRALSASRIRMGASRRGSASASPLPRCIRMPGAVRAFAPCSLLAPLPPPRPLRAEPKAAPRTAYGRIYNNRLYSRRIHRENSVGTPGGGGQGGGPQRRRGAVRPGRAVDSLRRPQGAAARARGEYRRRRGEAGCGACAMRRRLIHFACTPPGRGAPQDRRAGASVSRFVGFWANVVHREGRKHSRRRSGETPRFYVHEKWT